MSIFQRKTRRVVPVEQKPQYFVLTGVDKIKLLEGYESNLIAAEQRRGAIFDEIMRLLVEYQNTEQSIAAISASVNLLKNSQPTPPNPDNILDNEIQKILENEKMED